MTEKVREFIDTFVFVSVHGDRPYTVIQDRMAVEQLADRCIDLARDTDITKEQIEAEVGDLAGFFRATIDQKNTLARLAGESTPGHTTEKIEPLR